MKHQSIYINFNTPSQIWILFYNVLSHCPGRTLISFLYQQLSTYMKPKIEIFIKDKTELRNIIDCGEQLWRQRSGIKGRLWYFIFRTNDTSTHKARCRQVNFKKIKMKFFIVVAVLFATVSAKSVRITGLADCGNLFYSFYYFNSNQLLIND